MDAPTTNDSEKFAETYGDLLGVPQNLITKPSPTLTPEQQKAQETIERGLLLLVEQRGRVGHDTPASCVDVCSPIAIGNGR